jgi:hypothetical protein
MIAANSATDVERGNLVGSGKFLSGEVKDIACFDPGKKISRHPCECERFVDSFSINVLIGVKCPSRLSLL